MYNHSMILVKDLVEEPLRKTYINEYVRVQQEDVSKQIAGDIIFKK